MESVGVIRPGVVAGVAAAAPKPPCPRPPPRLLGRLNTIPARGTSDLSGTVYPERLMIAACPEISPPLGRDITWVMPTTRDTPMCALWGSIPQNACTLGLNRP